MSKKILVTGGAGYIGSHTIVDLIQHGYEVISVDNFLRSKPEQISAIEKITGVAVKNFNIDLCNYTQLKALFSVHQFDGIIHFGALKSVPESVQQPILYFENNIISTLNLIKLCQKHGVHNFVFSSSCSVYGNAQTLPVTELTPLQKAESPYGYTKQVGERMIQDASALDKVQYTLLRYFNPAGAHPSGLLGENPNNPPESLVPCITHFACGLLPKLQVYGNDYTTKDGSCIRDFIHVCDIAHAHTLALEQMLHNEQKEKVAIYNLGTGKGVSVLETLQAFETQNQLQLNYTIAPRRAGDVEAIYADNTKAQTQLNWHCQYTLNDIVKTAYDYQKKHQ